MKKDINCNRIIKGVLTTGLACVGIIFCTQSVSAADISVIVPTERAVYQRGYDNEADMTVKAECGDADKMRARVMDGETVVSDWTELKKSGDEFAGKIPDVKAGGWYQVEFEALDASGNKIGDAWIEDIGVGEVFITGGQSNSCNFGGEKTQAENDIVSALDPATGKWQHCEDSQPNTSGFATGNGGGSPWPSFGDALVERMGVPVGMVSTGFGGAKVSELITNHYECIKQAIERIEPYGCRAFLIHQGEADESTPTEEYKASYMELINKVRDDAGYDMNWVIAKVAYAWSNYNNTARMEELTGAQKAICNNYNIFEGPTTDDLQGEYRHTDNLHLSKLGLIEHGTRWAEVITNVFGTPYYLDADNIANGKIKECEGELHAGEQVTLTAIPDEGYYLVPGSFKVKDASGEEIELDNDSFIMRAENMKVSATFEKLPQYLLDLGAKIKSAEAINRSEYQQAGFAALDKAIADAKKVYANSSSTEAEAKAALSGIDAAMGALVKIAAPVQSTTPTTAPVTTVPTTGDTLTLETVKVGDIIVKSGLKFKVTSVKSGKCTVSVTGATKKSAKSIVIPKSVTDAGVKYTVTAIEKKAFMGMSGLKKVTIKSTSITSIGKKAFNKVNAKIKVKVPAKKFADYKKMLLKAGIKKSSCIKK